MEEKYKKMAGVMDMLILGEYEAQYANNLIRSKRLVLRTDRDAGDLPYFRIYENNTIDSIIIMIYNDEYIFKC